jgi:hypothetical protein
MPRYTVICEWSDSGPNGGYAVQDADEIVVVTDTPALAVEKARKKWRLTIGAEWPNCRLTNAFVLTKEKLAELL